MLCSLCFLLFKASCSIGYNPRPDTARRNQNRAGRDMCAQRRRGRGERVLGGSPFRLFLRALRVLCAEKKSSRPCVILTDCSAESAEKKFCQECRLLRHCTAKVARGNASLQTITVWRPGLGTREFSLRPCVFAPLRCGSRAFTDRLRFRRLKHRV